MGIVRPIMEVHPNAWMFFIPFIFMVTFIMVNLIVAVVVDAMSEINKSNDVHVLDEVHTLDGDIKQEMVALKEQIRELKDLLIQQAKN
jgi:voltage-gated sodium channel